MTYNDLFTSADGGTSWQNIQNGLPTRLYTFNVAASQGAVFAGHWDGVYRWVDVRKRWIHSGAGLSERFAQTNMKLYKQFIIVSGSEMDNSVPLGTAKSYNEWPFVY